MRSGFVSILGRPNTGKSTLLNALVGQKLAIVTAKPQTTRTLIRGVAEIPAGRSRPAAQIVFVATPGVLRPASQLDRRMMQQVAEALEALHVAILLVDATRRIEPSGDDASASAPGRASEDDLAFRLLRKLDRPVFLVVNKIDRVAREKLLPLIAQLSSRHSFAEVIPISAKNRDGLDLLVKKLIEYLPQGRRYFPKDQLTDQPVRFLAAELIRERILLETGNEVPYASAVVVERFEEQGPPGPGKKNRRPLTRIAAAIYCERAGQKAILIGKGGAKLKSIGAAARREMESLLGARVYLELHVTVEENWRESRGFLDVLDWRRQLEDLARDQERAKGGDGWEKRSGAGPSTAGRGPLPPAGQKARPDSLDLIPVESAEPG